METGSKLHSDALLPKQEFHFKPDNQAELKTGELRSFVDFGRDGVQVLKTTPSLKVVEMASFQFPFCADNQRWTDYIATFVESTEYRELIQNTEVSFSIADSHVTIVPQALFTDDKKSVLFNFTEAMTEETCIFRQDLSKLSAVGQFAVPSNLDTILSKKISNSYLIWLDEIITPSTKVCANLLIYQKNFSLVLSKEGKLLFSNWFNHSKSEDILYFLMATLEGLNILHTEARVVLNGHVNKNDELHLLLGKYLSELSFGSLPATLKYGYSIKELPDHRYPLIFHTACV